jgi:hydroxypyruvate isomerase
MLRFAANLSLLFTELPLLERFRAARQAGFAAVEIQFPYQLLAEQIHGALLENDLQLVLFNVDADMLLQGGEGLAAVPEKSRQFRDAVSQAARYAEVLKPQAINVLPGRCLDGRRYDEYRQTLLNNLRFAADRFAEIGVTTVFEAVNTHDMPGFIIDSSAGMLKLLAELNHPNLRLQYDIYHMTRMGEDCEGFLTKHLDKVGHIQFADCPGRGQPGTGGVDFSRLFNLIDGSSYQGWLGAEYKPQGATVDTLGWMRG